MKYYHDRKLKTTSHAVVNDCVDLIEEKTGLRMYEEQIKAALSMYKDNIVNLVTGGGKTLVVLLTAMLYLRDNRKVYVISTNDYLVKRDFDFASEIYDALDKNASMVLSPQGGTPLTYEKADVIYISGQTLVFDYLRGIPACYDVALIDEVDFILVEAASHTFAVSTEDSYVRPPEGLYRFASGISDILTCVKKEHWTKKETELFDYQYEADVILDMCKMNISITKRGYNILSEISKELCENKLFMEALLSCLYAKHFLKKDENYLVRDDEILLIDIDTGRVGIDCHYDICLQTALEIKENIPVHNHYLLKNDISYSVFFTLFETIVGISGTANFVPYDFGEMLGKEVKTQRPHFKVQRKEIFEYFENDEDRKRRVLDLVRNISEPILLVTATDRKSKEYYELLKEERKNVSLLTNQTLNNENDYLDMLKETGSLLISNKIVGRGTDITPNESNGLVVILAERLNSTRSEKQLIGRTGRNGIEGICYILTSKDDSLFSYSKIENFVLNEKNIETMQSVYEARQYDIRKYLHIRDKVFFDIDKNVLEKLMSFTAYEDMKDYVIDDENTRNKLREIIEKDYGFLPQYKDIIRHEYYKLRPFFQAQFQSYTDDMSLQFLSDQYFHEIAKIYIEMGNTFVADTIKRFLIKL